MEPMVEGGQWLSMGGTSKPHYVVDPAHIQRLLQEGYQIVTDPRIPAEAENEPEKEEPEDDDTDTTRRLTTAKPTNKARARGLDTTP